MLDEGVWRVFQDWQEAGEPEKLPFFRRRLEDLRGTASQNARPDLPMLISGMASSSIGMLELPYAQAPFALDGIAYITNKATKNISLNIQQLQDIYEGKITNWKQVGGEDKKITPILLSGLGRNTLFLSLTQLNPNTKYIEDRAEGMSLVEQEEGAIFYTSASLAATEQNVNIISLQNKDNQIVPPVIDGQAIQEAFQNGSYPQTRGMDAIQNQVQDMVHSFVNYLTSPQQGQSIVQESGFVPLYR